MAAIKKLEYETSSQQKNDRLLQSEILMSTMTKARPGIAVSGFITGAKDSGSDENVLDSNESSFEEEDQSQSN